MKSDHLRAIAAALGGNDATAVEDAERAMSAAGANGTTDREAEEILAALRSDPVDTDRLLALASELPDRSFLLCARECMVDLACGIDPWAAPAPFARYWLAVLDGLRTLAERRGLGEELERYTEGAAYATEVGLHEEYGPLLSPVPCGHEAMRGEPEALREGRLLDRVRAFLAQLAEAGREEPWKPRTFPD